MGVKLSLSSTERINTERDIHIEDVKDVINHIEMHTGWKVSGLIDRILKDEADVVSLRKRKPESFLFISNGIERVSIKFQKEKKEMRVSIPKTDIDSLCGRF